MLCGYIIRYRGKHEFEMRLMLPDPSSQAADPLFQQILRMGG